MRFSKIIASAILAGGVVISGVAGATVVDPLYSPSDSSSTPIDPRPIMIDFRTSEWSGANYQSSFMLGNVNKNTVGEDVGYFDILVTPNGSSLWQSWDDGLGVRGGENDEIDGTETLKVEFFEAGTSVKYAVPLYGVYLTDLFDNTNDGDTPYDETANVRLNLGGGSYLDYDFTSDNDLRASPNNNGEYYGAFGTEGDAARLVYSVLFSSSGNYPTNDEYSVAGFRAWPEPSVIPLPAALPLYGTGLAVMGLIGWRKKRKAATI